MKLPPRLIGWSIQKFRLKCQEKLEELKSDLNSHILDVINPALEEKVLPSIKNAMESKNSSKIRIWTFGHTDRIRVILVKYVLRWPSGQMDRIQKMLAKWLRMLRKTSQISSDE